MNILFTVCGRAGSKGFRNKNIKTMNGIPLAWYTLSVIKLFADRHLDYTIRTAINTDSTSLEDVCINQTLIKELKFVKRKETLAGDIVPKVEVIKDTYLSLKNERNYDIVVDLDITSPLRRVVDIENAISEFISNDEYDLVYSVVPGRRNPYFNIVEERDGFYHKVCSSNYSARQQAPSVYEMNASIYVYSPSFLESDISAPISDYKCGISMMRDYLVLDIDSEEDFRMMEFLHRYYIDDDAGIREVYETANQQRK